MDDLEVAFQGDDDETELCGRRTKCSESNTFKDQSQRESDESDDRCKCSDVIRVSSLYVIRSLLTV